MSCGAVASVVGLGRRSGRQRRHAGQVTGREPGGVRSGGAGDTLRLGYFPNITHATAIVGVEKGFFQKHLGDTKLETKTFNAGGDAVEALFAQRDRRAYIGPNPAINAFRSRRARRSASSRARRPAARSSSSKPDITTTPRDLKGKKIATPQLGNTQDVALRAWLKEKGWRPTTTGGGDVEIVTAGERRSARDVPARARSTARGCPSRGRRASSQEGGGKVLVDEGDAVAERPLRHDAPHRPDGVPRGAPGRGQGAARGPRRGGRRTSTTASRRGEDGRQRRHREDHRRRRSRQRSSTRRGRTSTFTVDPVASSLEKSDERRRSRSASSRTVDLKGIYDLDAAERAAEGDGREEVDEDCHDAHRHDDADTARRGRIPSSPSRRRRSRTARSGRRVLALDGMSLDVRRRRVRVPRRGVRLRQEHAAEADRRARQADARHGRRRRPRTTLLFQDVALFPWLTAHENVELALRLRGVAASRARASGSPSCSTSCTSAGSADKRPHELSGGMRQRVALARALAQDADVLLMDEPFGALDAMTRDLLHDELERVWQETGVTIVFVTHNVREAVRLGDRVVAAVEPSRAGRRGVPGRVRASAAHRVARGRRARRDDHRPAARGGERTADALRAARRH